MVTLHNLSISDVNVLLKLVTDWLSESFGLHLLLVVLIYPYKLSLLS